jgi:hypothetical protein
VQQWGKSRRELLVAEVVHCVEKADTRLILCWESVTGQRSNQLNYVPTRQINEMRNRQRLCGFARIA